MKRAQATPPDEDSQNDAARDRASAAPTPRAPRVNINPSTGLATDYLNHFNEAIMLLEIVDSCPECMDDFLAWQPMSYCEHFAASRLADRHAAISAYDTADPNARHSLETLANIMTEVLEATRTALRSGMPPLAARRLADRAAVWLKPLVARAGTVINGESPHATTDAETPQAAIDQLMRS